MRALLVVTHLLGAGHLTRTAAIARALAYEGHETVLVSGGRPTILVGTEGVRFVQLLPVAGRPDDLRTLRDETGAPATPERMAVRRAALLDLLASFRPDAIVTELFPFGRRALAAEFTALLEAADATSPRPLVACSVRDILVPPGKRAKADETHGRLAGYHAILVHADPNLVTLPASWPFDGLPNEKIHYTGYVDAGPPAPSPHRGRAADLVLVSGGSSEAGLPLYRAALAAARLVPALRWRLLVGHGVAAENLSGLVGDLPANVTVERARPDFRALLGEAALFVGQAGYNTAIDLLATRTPAVLVPFEAGQETEQRTRADHLARLGRALVLPEASLAGRTLADRVVAALACGPPPALAIDLDGARQTARVLARLVAAHYGRVTA